MIGLVSPSVGQVPFGVEVVVDLAIDLNEHLIGVPAPVANAAHPADPLTVDLGGICASNSLIPIALFRNRYT